MLCENIKALRRAKGLSQEALAARLHVVRQTVSKWETGLSVPDADLLLALSAALDAPVSALLGETLAPPPADGLQELAAGLEAVNLQLARRKQARRSALHWLLLGLCAAIVILAAVLLVLGSPYLGWDYGDPETAVAGAALHALEWLFVRLALPLFLAAAAGAFLTRKRA